MGSLGMGLLGAALGIVGGGVGRAAPGAAAARRVWLNRPPLHYQCPCFREVIHGQLASSPIAFSSACAAGVSPGKSGFSARKPVSTSRCCARCTYSMTVGR
jgi:hypothetical protein